MNEKKSDVVEKKGDARCLIGYSEVGCADANQCPNLLYCHEVYMRDIKPYEKVGKLLQENFNKFKG